MSSCRCPQAPYSPQIAAGARAALGRRDFLAGLAGIATGVLLGRPAAADPASVTVLRAARWFDGVRSRAGAAIVVRDGRIVSLSAGDAGSDATVVDLGDVTLLPGLIDAHTHVSANLVSSTRMLALSPAGTVADSIAEATIFSLGNARAMLANGFTTIRDVGGSGGIDLAIRDAVAHGYVTGPRILTAGRLLSITGGHGDDNARPEWVHVDSEYGPATAYGPYGFREQVREHVKRHVDLIKITATGGVLSYGDAFDVPQFNPDEIAAVVSEAEKFGLKVAAHAHGDRGIAEAVAGGCHSIEHATGVGEHTLHEMVQRGTMLVPTIWALDSIVQPGNPNKIPTNSLEKAEAAMHLRNEGLARALASSVRFAYGTDAGVFPHAQNNRDFALMQSHGMRPIDILRSATSVAAELLGTADRGRIAPGLLADFAAFRGDVASDASLLGVPPTFVMLGGKRVTG